MPSFFSSSPCRKASSITLWAHSAARRSGFVGLFRSAQWIRHFNSCMHVQVEEKGGGERRRKEEREGRGREGEERREGGERRREEGRRGEGEERREGTKVERTERGSERERMSLSLTQQNDCYICTSRRSLYLSNTSMPSLATFLVSRSVFSSPRCVRWRAMSVARTTSITIRLKACRCAVSMFSRKLQFGAWRWGKEEEEGGRRRGGREERRKGGEAEERKNSDGRKRKEREKGT